MEQQNVVPDAYLPQVTFILYVIVILGGAGTILGPILGAITFQFLFFTIDSFMADAQSGVGWVGDLLSPSDAAQVKLVLVGIGLMLLMVFRPQGLIGNREESLINER
jgi:branched-chain amino acid transport system permease protein